MLDNGAWGSLFPRPSTVDDDNDDDDDNDRQFCLWLFISELVVVSYSDCGGI